MRIVVILIKMFVISFRRSSTQGKGEYTMEYSRYSPCLPDVQEQIIRTYQVAQGLIVPDKEKEKKKKRG